MKRMRWPVGASWLLVFLLAVPVPGSAADTPARPCLDIGELGLHVTGTEIVPRIETAFGQTLTPTEGRRMLVVSLTGRVKSECEISGLATETFFILFREPGKTSTTAVTAGALNLLSTFWATADMQVQTTLSAGDLHWKAAFSIPDGVEEFWMGLPTTLPEPVRIAAGGSPQAAPPVPAPRRESAVDVGSGPVTLDRDYFVGTVWHEVIPGSDPPETYVQLRDDGTFAWNYHRPGDWNHDSNERWSVEEGFLVLSWNDGFCLDRMELDPAHPTSFTGVQSVGNRPLTFVRVK